jgi:hypothetical protein
METRVLRAHGLTDEEWAVLFTASYHSPLPRDQVVEMATQEVLGREVETGFQRCVDRGWIVLWESAARGTGVVLTDTGRRVKESVSEDLMATVFRRPAFVDRVQDYPPAMEPMMKNGSVPAAMAAGSGVSIGS